MPLFGQGRTVPQPPSPEMLALARDWKAGKLTPVSPEVGRLLNATLVRVGEDAVPFRRTTDASAPTIAGLIRAEHERAGRVQKKAHEAA